MPNHRKDYELAIEMYGQGLSIQDIAEYYGISRQAMWSILLVRKVKFRPQKRYGEKNVFYRGGATTQSMRVAKLTTLAIKKGVLVQPDACIRCGAIGRVEGHHSDYNRPLNVEWFCHKCHYEWHKTNTAIATRRELPPMPHKEVASNGGRKRQVPIDELLQR